MIFVKFGMQLQIFRNMGTRYQLGKNAVVCTTRTIYPIGEDAYAFPVTAI